MSGFTANIRVCRVCGVPIPAERLKILPSADTCVAHSIEQKHRTPSDDDHELRDQLKIVEAPDSEQ